MRHGDIRSARKLLTGCNRLHMCSSLWLIPGPVPARNGGHCRNFLLNLYLIEEVVVYNTEIMQSAFPHLYFLLVLLRSSLVLGGHAP